MDSANTDTMNKDQPWRYHRPDKNWLLTPDGTPRGYIQPHTLSELWFHTGTKCNLGCHFCLEGSGPKADRLQNMTLDDARPFMDEAVAIGVEQFSFTGGEPFVNSEFVEILGYAADLRSCLVLTNGTKPLRLVLDQVRQLADKPYPIKFRISLDYPDPKKHNDGRGSGSFELALKSLADFHQAGFGVSIARHQTKGEKVATVDREYRPFFEQTGLPLDTNIVSFPELHRPGDQIDVPAITENCMTTYKDEAARNQFMCAYSKMIVKTNNRVGVYACTLVDDDPDYDLGPTLAASQDVRIMLKHHRCYACFASGASCSER